MAEGHIILREDGFMHLEDCEARSVIYHPIINVVIVLTKHNEVRVLDVNSGIMLQSCKLGDENSLVEGRFLSAQEKIIVWNKNIIGVRKDYNGVLLLNTILQPPVSHNDDLVHLEMLLTEAVIFHQSIINLEERGVECPSDVANEFMEKIKLAQSTFKQGIKAQRWNTICIELPYSSLKLVANNVVFNLQRLDRHIPALAIASAVNERLTDLLTGSRVLGSNSGNFQRFLMYSESARRQTFDKWPHMDYKWALPDQMAQAGFYHQPSITGEDRVMCFTCNVCLVCWEKTDEPWSEHERHSPNCPFVKGEYTQNVPLSITYATSPAVNTNDFDIMSNSDYSTIICTSTINGEITIWSIDGQLRKLHTFEMSDHLNSLFTISAQNESVPIKSFEVTAICVLPNRVEDVSRKKSNNAFKENLIGSQIVIGFTIVTNSNQHIAYLSVFKIFDVNQTKDSPPAVKADDDDASSDKATDILGKCKTYASYDDEYLKLSDFYPWKTVDSDKATLFTKFSDLEDSPTKTENGTYDDNIDVFKPQNIQGSESEQSCPAEADILNDFKSENIDCLPVACICAGSESDLNIKIVEILPTIKCRHILLHVKKYKTSDANENSHYKSSILLWAIDDSTYLEKTFLSCKEFCKQEAPKSLIIFPRIENGGAPLLEKDAGTLCILCEKGSLKLIDIYSMKILFSVLPSKKKIVTATYCKTLERLCACTEDGSLIFYSCYDNDVDEKVEEDNLPPIAPEYTKSQVNSEHDYNVASTDIALESKKNPKNVQMLKDAVEDQNIGTFSSNILANRNSFSLNDLKLLYSLTLFDEKLTSYTADVPGCWNELVQVQKQRRHPQSSRLGNDIYFTKSWRLHKDATSWDEHVFEITLAKPASLGHVDLKFTLCQHCPNLPSIQVTLLKQNTSGFSYNMKLSHSISSNTSSVEKGIEFNIAGADRLTENPVLSEEYLHAHNAEILCGPVELSSCMDLCDQGGVVVLTSPKLFKTRARNLLIHMKTVSNPTRDSQAKIRGCDWLHEISVTVRSTKIEGSLHSERQQRIAMLESKNILEKLLKMACCPNVSKLEQTLALDILIWISSIRMTRFRLPNNLETAKESTLNPNSSNKLLNAASFMQQKECIGIIEENIDELISSCILGADRILSHKIVKLLLLLSKGVKNLPDEILQQCTFDSSLTNGILNNFSKIKQAKHSSAVRLFTLLINGTSNNQSHSLISENCIKLLLEITTEIEKRWNPYNAILNARFGLSGFPFESEIFDTPIHVTCSYGQSAYTHLMTSTGALSRTNGSNFKKLSSIDGVEFRSFPHLIKRKNVTSQLYGLLEVMPLHFSCSTASEATRIENIDSLRLNMASNINMEEIIVTSMQSNFDGQIDIHPAETENVNDDLLNNVKNILVDKIFNSSYKKQKEINSVDAEKGENVLKKDKGQSAKTKSNCSESYEDATCNEELSNDAKASNIQKYLNRRNSDEQNIEYSWHQLLMPPPDQMIIIERIQSGARRFVVLDFGSPIILTDLIFPACEELASLFIDIWCFEEELDCIRLATSEDIAVKTLIINNLQPPPICRFLKITIIGRYGLSATKCKIPIGSIYGHMIILENDTYPDQILQYVKSSPACVKDQIRALSLLSEDVLCRYSLSSSKLMKLLSPILNSDMSNVAHIEAFFNKLNEEELPADSTKICDAYEDCISLQYQLNAIKYIKTRLEMCLNPKDLFIAPQHLENASSDKLRVLSECLVEMLLHFSIEYGFKNIFHLHKIFNINVAKTLFNTLVLQGDAEIQLATCSLLFRMCSFQNWWGDFVANIICSLFSSQNTKIFPQDRVFFLLAYLGRKSIKIPTCRTMVLDSVLRTLSNLLAPLSPHSGDTIDSSQDNIRSFWQKTDLQLITWLLLFISVCLDDTSSRWEFMSCETDYTRSRHHSNSNNVKTYPRCFKKRIIQQSKYSELQSYTDWGKKNHVLQNELPEIFMELPGKQNLKSYRQKTKVIKEQLPESDTSFDIGLKSIKICNIFVVIRGLIALILEMDITCNMDLFLINCKVIARLISLSKPSVQLSKIVTSNQLEELIRLAVWNDQQHPWAIHAITCLLQDLLDTDKHYREGNANETVLSGNNSVEEVDEIEELNPSNLKPNYANYERSQIGKEIGCGDGLKYNQLPSLIECDDIEYDEFLNGIDMIDWRKCSVKRDSTKTNVNFFCKSVSNSIDARLDCGIDTNVEVTIRRLSMISSLDLYASLPQMSSIDVIYAPLDTPCWPDHILSLWSGPEYSSNVHTYQIFNEVFDNICADLYLQDSWIHLEQVLQMWLTLNKELAEKPNMMNSDFNETPKIPLGQRAIQSLLYAFAWHDDIKLKAWCLGFQCLILACNSYTSTDDNGVNIYQIITQDVNFEKMLSRFFSGYGFSYSGLNNRYAGPTICKYLHELILWLQMKIELTNEPKNVNRSNKLKDILLAVVLQLVVGNGPIFNRQGPLDAQSQLIQDLITISYEKKDKCVQNSIIENVSLLVFNHITNAEKLCCLKSTDGSTTSTAFGNLFATVLGSDNSKQNTLVSESSLNVSLLKLCSSFLQSDTQNEEKCSVPENDVDKISDVGKTTCEQENSDENKIKESSLADIVLQNSFTMKKFLGSLSNCNSSSFALLAASSLCSMPSSEISGPLNEPQTIAESVFQFLMLLCKRSSKVEYVVTPIYKFLVNNTSPRYVLPRLKISEPFLWYILKVLETPLSVSVFTKMGGIKIICENFIKCNKVLLNMHPGLISIIMHQMTRNVKVKTQKVSSSNNSCSNILKKPASGTPKLQEGLINFAPYCAISLENPTAQPADVLIQTQNTSHRRTRTPAWSYLFYPNESYVDLHITLPAAVLLREVQLQPHLPTLANCPSAVAIEISRDHGFDSVPLGPPLSTVGMTCIRLTFKNPEIAANIVIRLYRPKDSSTMGLTQISILGTTVFSDLRITGHNDGSNDDDDSIAKASLCWIRLLAQCFTVATFNTDSELSTAVVSSSAGYPGFLEACCSLLDVISVGSNTAFQNLETILLKLGTHNKQISLKLIHNLLWKTLPQTYRLSNESVSDLLYNVCITPDSFTSDRISVLLDWLLKLKPIEENDDERVQCANPQSGFVSCIASILWKVKSDKLVSNISEQITDNIFSSCLHWSLKLNSKEPLKKSFDSLLCTLCYIRPELFTKLLEHLELINADARIEFEQKGYYNSSNDNLNNECLYEKAEDRETCVKIVTNIALNSSHLTTLATVCQSTSAIRQLVGSGLPSLLVIAILEFCCNTSPDIRNFVINQENLSSIIKSFIANDKSQDTSGINAFVKPSVVNIDFVSRILNFFAETCSEGYMRDWLGSAKGSLFWRPLLELLCNYRPWEEIDELRNQQSFSNLEQTTIQFLSKVTTCHPKNQENLMTILISVIKKSNTSKFVRKTIISGFTRHLILELLLESERILVSVYSETPLQRREPHMYANNTHPSKRSSSNHLLFCLSTLTKCQEILQNCVSVFSNIIPRSGSVDESNGPNFNSSVYSQVNDNQRDLYEMDLALTGHGMEFLSVVAGVTAKDKRLKEVKNKAAALKERDIFQKFTKLRNEESQISLNMISYFELIHPECPDIILMGENTISQILSVLQSKGISLSAPCISLHLVRSNVSNHENCDEVVRNSVTVDPMLSPLQRFSNRGGLSLLAQYLPTVYPKNSKSMMSNSTKQKNASVSEWVKVEQNEEIYEDLEDVIHDTSLNIPTISSVPQHSLTAFGLFLRLPSYSEVLLQDKLRAQCLLRLVLGVTGDSEGNNIYSLSVAPSLPTLPFEVFRQLLDTASLTTSDGILLRQMVIEVGAMNLVLNCLGVLTHCSRYQLPGSPNELTGSVKSSSAISDDHIISDDKSHIYWAKGTGFGTGSTQQSWDVEQALLRQKSEEEHVTILFQVLSSYINPGDKTFMSSTTNSDNPLDKDQIAVDFPPIFLDLLQQSCLIQALSSYLRNDSVLDITRHIPLYRSVLQLLRALASTPQLNGLLQYQEVSQTTSIATLLANMKTCVDTYARRLKLNKKSNIKGQVQKVTVHADDGDDEGLALLIPDIQATSLLVQTATQASKSDCDGKENESALCPAVLSKSIEQRYLEIMKKLQFDSFEMIIECDEGFRFVVSYHFENNLRVAGDRGHPSRVKRLAQETVTLSTSLPLSYSSSVFVRCDTDRLDIMKVLITGPSETPYANGCFEFDVYFPPDYPNSPMLINLETTGRHSVRFNPNLYNDGKVCLSVLNTWHGRPEEKWNAQTSSFLQVLVSIQSLILVPEPYFNEPGFERSRGTPNGTHCSREYNSNIYQACVRWAMLEQIRNPSPCFKEVIHTHFWLKRNEICAQIEGWIDELSKPQISERSGRTISFNSMVLRRQYRQLKDELAKLSTPDSLEDLDIPFNTNSIVHTINELSNDVIHSDLQNQRSDDIQVQETLPKEHSPSKNEEHSEKQNID